MMKRPDDYRVIEPLRKKGYNVLIPILDRESWTELTQKDPSIPRSYSELKRLATELFDPTRRKKLRKRHWHLQPHRGLIAYGFEECGESAYSRFFVALSNPWLLKAQLMEIEADVDADTPTFENSEETTHFILRWTNASANAADNIADPAIVTETGAFLEKAWGAYHAAFGADPYVPAGATKIEVLFHDIAGYGVASPPDGPIQFDASNWVNQPGIRRSTSAHELFHKLQYTYGYRTIWTPSYPYKWFSEGTASWAEVFVWQRVSGAYKILDLFTNPDINLYDASYRALPFWVFFQARQQSTPGDNPMVGLLQRYQLSGDDELVLEQSVADEWPPNNVHGELAHFFALFSRERTWNAWKTGPCGAVYTDILGPDGNPIAPALTRTEVNLGPGDSYGVTGAVSQLGSDYHRFSFTGAANGATLAISVDGASVGDFSYYLVWEKGGAFARGVFPFTATEDYGFSETIDLSFADSVTMIVSGRGTGGSYTLSASLS